MRIAQVAPLIESVPPKLYGGTERVVSYLTEELVRQGHDVTLFASGDSRTSARLVPCSREALRLDPGVRDPLPHAHAACSSRCGGRRDRFDVLHFHIDYLHFPLFRADRRAGRDHAARPARPARPARRSTASSATCRWSRSRTQPARGRCRRSSWVGTVHHGLPRDLLRFSPEPGAATSPSSAASRRRSGPTGRSRSPSAPACRCKIAAKVDQADRALLRARRSSRCSTTRWSSSSARSATRRRRRSSAARWRCCSRSTGRSRSAW